MWQLLVNAQKDIQMTVTYKEENSLKFRVHKNDSILEAFHKLAPIHPEEIIFHEQDYLVKQKIQSTQSKLMLVVDQYSDFFDIWMTFDLFCARECDEAIATLDELDQKYLISQSDQGALNYAQWISSYTNFLKSKKDCFKSTINDINLTLDTLEINNESFLKPYQWDQKIERLTAMGFERDICENALIVHKGNEEVVVHELLENKSRYTQRMRKSTSKNSLSMEEKAFDKFTNFFAKKYELDSPLSPSRPNKEENITVNMGRQLRTPYNFKLISGNLKMLFTYPTEHIFYKSIKSQTINNLLDNVLTAVVLLVPKKHVKKYLQGYTLNLDRLSVHNYGTCYLCRLFKILCY